MELLTGFGLATAAGLNAYIPLLALGLLGRFTHLVTLPHGWTWLENGWVMAIVAVLLVVEVVADKIPALDSVNDAIQTFVRPTAGGIVFGSGTAAQTAAVTDPGSFVTSGQWIPIAIGVVTALVVSPDEDRRAPCGQRRDGGGRRAGAEHDRGRDQHRAGVRRDPVAGARAGGRRARSVGRVQAVAAPPAAADSAGQLTAVQHGR